MQNVSIVYHPEETSDYLREQNLIEVLESFISDLEAFCQACGDNSSLSASKALAEKMIFTADFSLELCDDKIVNTFSPSVAAVETLIKHHNSLGQQLDELWNNWRGISEMG